MNLPRNPFVSVALHCRIKKFFLFSKILPYLAYAMGCSLFVFSCKFTFIEKGSVVAVSTYMASEHDNRQDQKEWFIAGYNEMLRRIEPEKIICYNTPFPEMQGNIIYVDYERSSWKYMSYECTPQKEDLDAFKIGCASRLYCDTIEPYLIGKGGGSAYGGDWKPSKPEDYRLLGQPGEVKTTYKNGYRIDTKIGPDGKAIAERHYTDHKQPWAHSNPHDHDINWETPRYGIPNFVKPNINYWPDEYPNGVPDFKSARRAHMKYINNSAEENRFKTISEFKECLIRGGEIIFSWHAKNYAVSSYTGKISISESYRQETEKLCDTPDEVLDYMVDSDRLRDVITQVTVLDRTI